MESQCQVKQCSQTPYEEICMAEPAKLNIYDFGTHDLSQNKMFSCKCPVYGDNNNYRILNNCIQTTNVLFSLYERFSLYDGVLDF